MKQGVIGLAVVAACVLGSAAIGWAQVANGEPAPDFALPDTTGGMRSLSAYQGSTVVLEWLNPDCPFVKKHYNSGTMPALQQDYTLQGVIWLSIVSSAPGNQGHYPAEEMAGVIAQLDSRATAVLLDEAGTVGRQYGAKTTPHMFIVDAGGAVVYQGAIDSIASADPADIAAAEPYVRLALEAIVTGAPVAVSQTKPYGCSVKY